MHNAKSNQTDAAIVNVDAFMSLARIGFSSIERLATLNLNTSRALLNDGAAKAAKLQTKGQPSAPDLSSLLSSATTNSALSYLQSVQEIAADTQKEVTELMTSYFSSQTNGDSATIGWAKGFELFKNFGQQITTMTETNTKTVSDAANRVTNTVTAQAKKSA